MQQNWFFVVLGSTVISLGASLIGFFAFRSQVLMVFAGIVLIDLGYRVSQIEDASTNELRNGLSDSLKNRDFIMAWTGLLIGSFLVAQGFVTGANATQNLQLSYMAFSGILVSSGYLVGHTTYINHYYGG